MVPGLQTPGPSGATTVQAMVAGFRFTFLTSVTTGSACAAGVTVTVPSEETGASTFFTGAQSVQSQQMISSRQFSRQCRQPVTRTDPRRPAAIKFLRQNVFIHPHFLNSRPRLQYR